jgi:hypothetical protein
MILPALYRNEANYSHHLPGPFNVHSGENTCTCLYRLVSVLYEPPALAAPHGRCPRPQCSQTTPHTTRARAAGPARHPARRHTIRDSGEEALRPPTGKPHQYKNGFEDRRATTALQVRPVPRPVASAHWSAQRPVARATRQPSPCPAGSHRNGTVDARIARDTEADTLMAAPRCEPPLSAARAVLSAEHAACLFRARSPLVQRLTYKQQRRCERSGEWDRARRHARQRSRVRTARARHAWLFAV